MKYLVLLLSLALAMPANAQHFLDGPDNTPPPSDFLLMPALKLHNDCRTDDPYFCLDWVDEFMLWVEASGRCFKDRKKARGAITVTIRNPYFFRAHVKDYWVRNLMESYDIEDVPALGYMAKSIYSTHGGRGGYEFCR